MVLPSSPDVFVPSGWLDVVDGFGDVGAGRDPLEREVGCSPLFRDLGLRAPKAFASFFDVLFILSSSPTIVGEGRSGNSLRRRLCE
jgi:hypothetical protein